MLNLNVVARRNIHVLLLLFAALTNVVMAQDESGSSGTSDMAAATIANPEIPLEHLEFLVKPLTQEELVIEANAWRDILKSKIAEISDLRIAIKQLNSTGAEAEAGAESIPMPEGSVQELSQALPQLQNEKTQFIDRFQVVLDELELKGGEVETYEKYITAQMGVAVDVTDTATTWALVEGWLFSEQGGQRWMWNLIKFFAILLAFYFGASIISNIIAHAVGRIRGVSQLLVNFSRKFTRQICMVIGLIVALAALEVDITPLIAAVGAAGFVVGFALQGTLSNFASGLMILGYRPFDVGHVIEAAGVSGIVDSVSLFSTHVRTFDNKMMIVPNNEIWGGTITNATVSPTRRVDMVFGIGYDDDTTQARQIMEEIIQEHELVLEDPAPVVKLNELADSSINFICRPWTKTSDYWTVYWDVTQQVKERFEQAGISIPYPQRDVHVYQESGSQS